MENKNKARKISRSGFFLGIILFILLIIFPVSDSKPASDMTAVGVLMATWWMTNALPLSATSLMPAVLFPLLGIMKGKETAAEYFNSVILLFLGGFIIASAMQKTGLHKRIAFFILNRTGKSPAVVILGFMIATAFLSMFISNTATAVMMFPVAIAVTHAAGNASKARSFGTPLMLAIAYSASAGGIATLIGTPPNLAFNQIYHSTFPEAPEISFGHWLIFALPLSLTMLGLIWLILTKFLHRKELCDINLNNDRSFTSLPAMSVNEKKVMFVFVLSALLWTFRTNINIGAITIYGWTNLIGLNGLVDDGTIAVAMSVLLFILPDSTNKGSGIVGVEQIRSVPWEIILLFGGGFALAEGFQHSGLSGIIGNQFSALSDAPVFLIIILTCLILTFLTELTSNTATTQTLLPILASVGIGMGINPLLLMIPATISASCAFMLPIATPPNAIVFGSGYLEIHDMTRAGLILNLAGALIISTFFYFIGSAVLGIDPAVQPIWAH